MAFSWLVDLHKSQCYTTGDWTNPSKSIDFGDNGYTASLTDWHELLQLTAPDPLCGIVFLRGNFPNATDAILARAQQRDKSGKKGTFGLEIDPTASDFELGERRDQGFVNFRWPYIQYELKRKYEDGGVEQIQIGTYESISFVKDGIVFQVVCLRSGRLLPQGNPTRRLKIRFKLGGCLQFGCPCSNGRPYEGETEEEAHNIPQMHSWDDGKRLGCISSHYQKRLEIQLFINHEPKNIIYTASSAWAHNNLGRKVQVDATEEVEIVAGKPTIIVATYALRDSSTMEPVLTTDSFGSIADYLGVSNDSERMSDRLWTACLTTNYDAAEAVEFCAIATAVEQTLCVSSVPVISACSNNAPENASQQTSDSLREHSTVLEKFSLGQTPISDRDSGIALVRNIMAGQYVDLQSTLYVSLTP